VKISHGKTDRQIGRKESNKINANIPLYFKTCCQRRRGRGIKDLFDIVEAQKKTNLMWFSLSASLQMIALRLFVQTKEFIALNYTMHSFCAIMGFFTFYKC
jgi:hypothetical protein